MKQKPILDLKPSSGRVDRVHLDMSAKFVGCKVKKERDGWEVYHGDVLLLQYLTAREAYAFLLGMEIKEAEIEGGLKL